MVLSGKKAGSMSFILYGTQWMLSQVIRACERWILGNPQPAMARELEQPAMARRTVRCREDLCREYDDYIRANVGAGRQ
jgi:hypothetical protein